MILCAGFGSRMGELTRETPKCLVSLDGRPLVEHVLQRFVAIGITEVALNLHYLGDRVRTHFAAQPFPGVRLIFLDEAELLGTGGGVRNAAQFFAGAGPFIVHNCDVWSDIDLIALVKFHQLNSPLATLAVQHRSTSRVLLGDSRSHLKGWEDKSTGRQILASEVERADLTPFGFTGIQIIDPRFYHYLNMRSGEASIIDSYLDAALADEKIVLSLSDDAHWFDIGTPDRLRECENFIHAR